MEEKELIKLRNGDEHTLHDIYCSNYNMLCSFAYQVLKDREAAEEVVDDVFIYVWQHREEVNIPCSVSAFLLGLVRNRSISYMRQARFRHETRLPQIGDEQLADFFDMLFSDERSPISDVLKDEFEEYYRKAIGSLPEKTRKVWEMSRHEHIKYEKISKVMGISVNTVRYHIKQATELLSQLLAKYI